jgi:methyl-accepting chemotaxis protein
VVAGEVRQLAERTSVATKEIDQTVRNIQTGTAEVVQAMSASLAHVESGVESARSAGHALDSIIHGSESVQKMVTQIASAATEQSYSTQSVVASVNEIASIIARTAASSEQSVDACEQLSKLANELAQLVGSFKVGRDHGDHGASELPGNVRAMASSTRPPQGFGRPVPAVQA